MNFEKVWAPTSVKDFLKESIEENRISHAQLFVGKPGWGTLPMALAYAEAVISEDKESSQHKIQNLSHPDLHFSIPTFKMEKTAAMTKNYIQPFKNLILENPFISLNDWYETLNAGNKQGFLGKDEMAEIMHDLTLKSFEGGYKVLIIWNADKMNSDYANKILKLLEEPPEKTLFLLLTESTENMLETITSRCVTVNFKPLDEVQLMDYGQEQLKLDPEKLEKWVDKSEGDILRLRQLASFNENRALFEEEFVEWTRNSFLVKKNLNLLQNIMDQSEKIASWNTEQQKQYLEFCMDIFRSALMHNYQLENLSRSEIESVPFQFDKFSKYISGANIEEILKVLNDTYYYIERNANKKLAFSNLGIKLTRYIHKKN